MFFFNYIPWFQQIIGTMQIPFEYFLFPIAYGLGLLILEETVISKFVHADGLAQVFGPKVSSWIIGSRRLVNRSDQFCYFFSR